MRRQIHLGIIAVTLLLLLGAAPAVKTNDALCAGGGTKALETNRRETYHRLSMAADAVSGGRRRAVNPPDVKYVELPVANFIDAHVAAKQKADRVQPTVIAGDEEFLRRVMLDLTGQIPDAAAVLAFVADGSPDKRARKIDELLNSEAFNDRWTMWFGDLVQNVQFSTNSALGTPGRNTYYTWIRESIRTGKSYDAMVRELLTGKGDSYFAGPANYVVRQMQPNGPIQDTYDNLATHSVEKFMGMPALCLSCHGGQGHLELVNWYLRNKTRNDFWGMAAFFSRTNSRLVRTGDMVNPVKWDVTDNNTGAYRLTTRDGNKSPRIPAEGEPITAAPRFLTTGEEPKQGENWRDAYARMLTADRQFARATVNYLWKEMVGLGLVEPVNAFDLSKLQTQPLNAPLLEALTDEFITRNYDLRALLRAIAMSNTYQLSARYTPGVWNEAWVPYFARRYPRRLMAEALFDAVTTATAVPQPMNVQGLGSVQRAMQLPDPLEGGRGQNSPGLFLDQFGRGDRDEVSRSNDSAISQSLMLMNSQLITSRIKRATRTSTVGKVLAASQDPAVIAEQLYLATLSRKPTAEERQVAVEFLSKGTLGDRAEDLQFVLINSLEFLFN